MKNLKITKEKVLEASEICSDTKRVLKTLFPEVFESELEIGKWYKSTDNSSRMLYFLDGEDNYGVDGCGIWRAPLYHDVKNMDEFKPATDSEVEKALIKEYNKKYDGKSFKIENCLLPFTHSLVESVKYIKNHNCLYIVQGGVGGQRIFEDGKWMGEIIEKKELTVKQIEDKLGYSIKIVK